MDENTITQGTEETTPEQADNIETPKLEEKLLTQAEVDRIVQREKAKAAKKMPDKTEWEEFQKYKSEKQTEAEKHAETAKQLEAARAEIAELKNRDAAMKAGCKPEFVDFLVHTVTKMDGEFSGDLEEFKKSNPQYFASDEKPTGGNSVKLGTAPRMTGGNSKKTVSEIMNIKDTAERQRAIAENMHLFTN